MITLIPTLFASAQNELTQPATSKTVFPINSCGSRRTYRRYSSSVRPSKTTRSSCRPRLASWNRLRAPFRCRVAEAFVPNVFGGRLGAITTATRRRAESRACAIRRLSGCRYCKLRLAPTCRCRCAVARPKNRNRRSAGRRQRRALSNQSRLDNALLLQ